jgi:hypothetical protein
MSTEPKLKLYETLLKITAEDRFRFMKEIWDLNRTQRIISHDTYKDAVCRSLTLLRKDIFEKITSESICYAYPIIRDIAICEDMPQLKKNISILAICGMEAGCIAALNCVNIGYVKLCIRTLKADFPELFG